MRKTMGATALFTTGGDFNPCVVDSYGDGYDHGISGLVLVSEEVMVMNILLYGPLILGVHTHKIYLID